MSGSNVPYRLRPNKSVDRELFLGLLLRLTPWLDLKNYQYIGLGGPFLDDFRMLHGRIGIGDMVCLETEEKVFERQKFNRPVDCITCINKSLEDYLDSKAFEKPSIIWFDYTDPRELNSQMNRFADSLDQVVPGSILRITLNANPSSLGKPSDDELKKLLELGHNEDALQIWRLEKFRQKTGKFFPNKLDSSFMTTKNFGKAVLKVLVLVVDDVMKSIKGKKISWVLATHYSDGQAMVTATLLITEGEEKQLEENLSNWEFHSTPDSPMVLDLPFLSTRERLEMESKVGSLTQLEYELPRSDMAQDPIESFKRFYRFFPHFTRVEF